MAAQQKGAPSPGRSKEIIESEDESDDDHKSPSDPFHAILSICLADLLNGSHQVWKMV